MRIERWYWLVVFCLVSLSIHALLGLSSRAYTFHYPVLAAQNEIEVTLTPGKEKKPAPPLPTPKPEPRVHITTAPIKATPIKEDAVKVEKQDVPAVQITRKIATEHVRLKPMDESKILAPIKQATEPVGLPDTEKLQNEAPPLLGNPDAPSRYASPRIASASRALTVPKEVAGGSPSPDKTLTGKGGASGPEAPPEETLFTGGGAGGNNLPKAPAKIGGGGGSAILSVENPLAKEAIPEDKPGLEPGTGGGIGSGAGGGVGFRAGKGIGTRREGRDALATLSSKSGSGIGAGTGSNIGTNAPGGGKGTGAEQPGTGGEGTGYGRGKGIEIGSSSRGESGGLNRGIPFGDITGMLARGKPTGSGSGETRGGVFGQSPTIRGGGNSPIHIIYLLDTSGSMKDGGKIYKAKDALCKALIELRPSDTFNIMNFDRIAHPFMPDMLAATTENKLKAFQFVNNLRLNPYTNVSDAVDHALAEPTVTNIFILSDGEPNTGISKFMDLRVFIKEKNTRHVQINTLALGLGERFDGMRLLKSIAEDNDGQYGYVNLLNDTAQPGR